MDFKSRATPISDRRKSALSATERLLPAAPETLNLRQRLLGFVQVLGGGNPSLIDQRAFRLVGKFKVGELDAKVIDEDRAPFVTRVCLQQNILAVQKSVDDAAGKAPQTIDGRRGLAWIVEMESERLAVRRSMKHLLAGVGINSAARRSLE